MTAFAVDAVDFFGFDQVQMNERVKADLGAVNDGDTICGITLTGHADRIGPPACRAPWRLGRLRDGPAPAFGIAGRRLPCCIRTADPMTRSLTASAKPCCAPCPRRPG